VHLLNEHRLFGIGLEALEHPFQTILISMVIMHAVVCAMDSNHVETGHVSVRISDGLRRRRRFRLVVRVEEEEKVSDVLFQAS
jgi:hypothetical protein